MSQDFSQSFAPYLSYNEFISVAISVFCCAAQLAAHGAASGRRRGEDTMDEVMEKGLGRRHQRRLGVSGGAGTIAHSVPAWQGMAAVTYVRTYDTLLQGRATDLCSWHQKCVSPLPCHVCLCTCVSQHSCSLIGCSRMFRHMVLPDEMWVLISLGALED